MKDLLYFIWVNVIFFWLPLIILGASVVGIIALIRTKKLPPCQDRARNTCAPYSMVRGILFVE